VKHDQARNFTFRLPNEAYGVLSTESARRGITIARLVRLAVAAFLEASDDRGNALARSESSNG
jgi:predicted DNA-binding protein